MEAKAPWPPWQAHWPSLLSPFLPPPPHFPRDLDARAKNECYRATFRLPRDERLDGHTSCTLWTPFNKLHIPGQMFISSNYICFASKEEDACHLIIPLREVSSQSPRQLCPDSLVGHLVGVASPSSPPGFGGGHVEGT